MGIRIEPSIQNLPFVSSKKGVEGIYKYGEGIWESVKFFFAKTFGKTVTLSGTAYNIGSIARYIKDVFSQELDKAEIIRQIKHASEESRLDSLDVLIKNVLCNIYRANNSQCQALSSEEIEKLDTSNISKLETFVTQREEKQLKIAKNVKDLAQKRLAFLRCTKALNEIAVSIDAFKFDRDKSSEYYNHIQTFAEQIKKIGTNTEGLKTSLIDYISKNKPSDNEVSEAIKSFLKDNIRALSKLHGDSTVSFTETLSFDDLFQKFQTCVQKETSLIQERKGTISRLLQTIGNDFYTLPKSIIEEKDSLFYKNAIQHLELLNEANTKKKLLLKNGRDCSTLNPHIEKLINGLNSWDLSEQTIIDTENALKNLPVTPTVSSETTIPPALIYPDPITNFLGLQQPSNEQKSGAVLKQQQVVLEQKSDESISTLYQVYIKSDKTILDMAEWVTRQSNPAIVKNFLIFMFSKHPTEIMRAIEKIYKVDTLGLQKPLSEALKDPSVLSQARNALREPTYDLEQKNALRSLLCEALHFQFSTPRKPISSNNSNITCITKEGLKTDKIQDNEASKKALQTYAKKTALGISEHLEAGPSDNSIYVAIGTEGIFYTTSNDIDTLFKEIQQISIQFPNVMIVPGKIYFSDSKDNKSVLPIFMNGRLLALAETKKPAIFLTPNGKSMALGFGETGTLSDINTAIHQNLAVTESPLDYTLSLEYGKNSTNPSSFNPQSTQQIKATRTETKTTPPQNSSTLSRPTLVTTKPAQLQPLNSLQKPSSTTDFLLHLRGDFQFLNTEDFATCNSSLNTDAFSSDLISPYLSTLAKQSKPILLYTENPLLPVIEYKTDGTISYIPDFSTDHKILGTTGGKLFEINKPTSPQKNERPPALVELEQSIIGAITNLPLLSKEAFYQKLHSIINEKLMALEKWSHSTTSLEDFKIKKPWQEKCRQWSELIKDFEKQPWKCLMDLSINQKIREEISDAENRIKENLNKLALLKSYGNGSTIEESSWSNFIQAAEKAEEESIPLTTEDLALIQRGLNLMDKAVIPEQTKEMILKRFKGVKK